MPVNKYRPSNSTEGDRFFSAFCKQCKKDLNNDCEIMGATMAFDIDDEGYPQEWQIGDDGQPTCTAWVDVEAEGVTPRCKNTVDMFS